MQSIKLYPLESADSMMLLTLKLILRDLGT